MKHMAHARIDISKKASEPGLLSRKWQARTANARTTKNSIDPKSHKYQVYKFAWSTADHWVSRL
jgi:hypothetical protein